MFEYYNYNKKIPKNRYLEMDKILRTFYIKLHGKEEYNKRKEFFDNEGFDIWLNTIINTPDYNIILYIVDNEIKGFICYQYYEENIWICEIQLVEEYQYKGYVKVLLQEMLNQINNKCNYFLGSIHPNNEHSINTFTHIGMTYNEDNHRYEISYEKLKKYIKMYQT